MATIRVKNPSQGGEKWITIPTKIQSEADHIVTNKGQGDLYLSNDGTYKDVIKSANDYTDKQIELITGSSPDILETLKELSNQTSDNKDFINVLNKSIATKLDKTANAVSASKLATPIKLWGNDFDGSQSVYGNLCAPNGNQGLGINANNVVLGNNTNPSYIYGSSVMFKTGTDAVAAYISPDGKVGIGTANPQVGFHVNVNSYFDYPIKVSGTVDHSSPLLKLDATNTNNNGLLVLSKLGNSKAAIGIDDTQGMWFQNLSNSNIFRITSNSLTYGSNKIWHEGNFNPSDYLPLTGGTVNYLQIGNDSNEEYNYLVLKRLGKAVRLNNTSDNYYLTLLDLQNENKLLNSISVGLSGIRYAEDGLNGPWYKIWHSGNDGEGSGLDADMLDGLHSGNFAKSLMDVGANNTKSNVLGYTYSTEAHGGASAGGLISAGMGTHGMQLNGAYNGNKLSFRGFSPDGYTDWKTLAFTDYNGFYNLYGGTRILPSANNIVDLNNYKTVGTYHVMQYSDTQYVENMPERNSFILHVVACNGAPQYYLKQIFQPYDSAKEYVRFYPASSGRWSEWWLSNDDLNTYNAPTATKLQTTVKLWGNDFDGSNNIQNDLYLYKGTSTTSDSAILRFNGTSGESVQGPSIRAINAGSYGRKRLTIFQHHADDYTTENEVMTILPNGFVGIGTVAPSSLLQVMGTVRAANGFLTENNSSIKSLDTSGNALSILELSNSNNLYVGYSTAPLGYSTYIQGSRLVFTYGKDKTPGMVLTQSGNVGIGTTDPQYKLDVNGTGHFSNDVTISNSKSFAQYDNKGNSCSLISLGTGNEYVIGYGVASREYPTYLDGNKLLFRTSKYHQTRMVIDDTGNVGIGTDTPAYKLDVDGKLHVSGSAIFDGVVNISTNNGAANMLEVNTSGFHIGFGIGYRNLDTTLYGYNIILKNLQDKTSRTSVTVNRLGNVTIGALDYASTNYKLYVDGKVNIGGSLNFTSGSGIYFRDSESQLLNVFELDASNQLTIGHGPAGKGHSTFVYGKDVQLGYGVDRNVGMILNSSGNVTIGGSDLAGTNKLYIDGNLKINGYTYAKGPVYTHGKSSSSDGVPGVALIKNNDSGWVSISGATPVIGFHFGNSSISTSQLKEVSAGKLQFDCSLDITNTVGIGDDLYVTDKIAMGDLVDWYGVSWSEDSSDPTCTRIGNMALHRSLPIQNAMKGYFIDQAITDSGQVIIPFRENWNILQYSANTNSQISFSDSWRGNTMVKIPEFWYIDDYDGVTKTHNLKISQTAKAGWCHHKEAYVGAYEGYSDGTHYRSQKGKIPTVSVSRTTLRPLARANGYENEYKWNIYTYEEHRAICHLFLVEYATRNSQAPVNTELTTDGFKQGGLGSGCTTGSVTINGQTTYSFIPTGTTDSLGNGSGQVAYTVTQTDADGNEISTVTRYANRYRGIENPFGHIWKHVDDIVNVYNAETTYKTVYKCNKPEHFATNKNAKYKPLCSFPGGSKMQGWSKEIKATINCDFFKYSVGGSESTYWCDYNYDNDDTSEHCLLIGSNSVNGGAAGLFRFDLDSGVGVSSGDVGSRLTYLPWAE